MTGILDNFNISGNVAGVDVSYDGKLDSKPVYTEAQKEYEKSERNRKLIWVGFVVMAAYIAYISFIKK